MSAKHEYELAAVVRDNLGHTFQIDYRRKGCDEETPLDLGVLLYSRPLEWETLELEDGSAYRTIIDRLSVFGHTRIRLVFFIPVPLDSQAMDEYGRIAKSKIGGQGINDYFLEDCNRGVLETVFSLIHLSCLRANRLYISGCKETEWGGIGLRAMNTVAKGLIDRGESGAPRITTWALNVDRNYFLSMTRHGVRSAKPRAAYEITGGYKGQIWYLQNYYTLENQLSYLKYIGDI